MTELRPHHLPRGLRDAHDVVLALPALVLRLVAAAGDAVLAAAEDAAALGGRAGALGDEDRGLVLADVADAEVLDVFAHSRDVIRLEWTLHLAGAGAGAYLEDAWSCWSWG